MERRGGSDAFSGSKGELRFDRKADKTFVYGDVDGNGKADLRIELADAMNLPLSQVTRRAEATVRRFPEDTPSRGFLSRENTGLKLWSAWSCCSCRQAAPVGTLP